MPPFRLGHYRRSCDRCHGQKLRCKRDDSSSSCQRCLRAKTKCTLSVPVQQQEKDGFLSSHQSELVIALSRDDGSTVSLPALANLDASFTDTRGLGLDRMENILTSWGPEPSHPFLGLPHNAIGPHHAASGLIPTVLSHQDLPKAGVEISSAPSLWQNETSIFPAEITPNSGSPTATGTPGRPRASTPTASGQESGSPLLTQDAPSVIRQLSHLNADLFEFTSSLPPASAWENPEAFPVTDREFALGIVLNLSQSFIDILDRISSPNEVRGNEKNTEGSTTIGNQPRAVLCADQSCELLVLSTYLRIVDIYHLVLEHVAACVGQRQSASDPSQVQDFMHLPSLSVGSFTMQSSNKTQVLTLLHMIEVVTTNTRRLVQRKITPAAGGESSGENGDARGRSGRSLSATSSDVVLETLRPKEDATMQLLKSVRAALLALGD